MAYQRLLVVEDDPDGQAVVAHILSYMNIPIDVAGDAETAAFYLFQKHIQYGLAIIDLALPGKDGFALLNDIISHPETSELPCVAVTAYHTSKLREQAIAAGFRAYFAKPIDATSFGREVTSLL
jgi:CheY-like chemotaxis protein